MRDRTAFDKKGDFGGIELLLGVEIGVPVDFDRWEVLD